jgi:hypothetical protein
MFDKQDEIVKAASEIGDQVYSQPYTNKSYNAGGAASFFSTNHEYHCKNKAVIHRPNHNMANILRTLFFLDEVHKYFKISGNARIKSIINEHLDNKAIERIRFALLFYTSGRRNEVGWYTNQTVYMEYREQASKNFLDYFSREENGKRVLLDKYPFEATGSAEENKKILDSLEKHALCLHKPYDSSTDDFYAEGIRLYMRLSHALDLLRCEDFEYIKNSPIKLINEYSVNKSDVNCQRLMHYAEDIIEASGDKLTTSFEKMTIPGSSKVPSFSSSLKPKPLIKKPIYTGKLGYKRMVHGVNEEEFLKSCDVSEAGVEGTINKLSKVQKPSYVDKDKFSKESLSAPEEIFELIKKGNAALRIFNGNLNSETFFLELSNLTESHIVRPLRDSKLKINRRDTLYLIGEENGKKKIRLIQRKKTSKQEERGKNKITPFSKKQSYSLIPQNGLFHQFKGRFLEKFKKGGYLRVGFVHDIEMMNTKDEKYLFSDDVRTSGVAPYFWLTNKRGSKKVKGLDKRRIKHWKKSLKELKDTVNSTQYIQTKKYSEMLICGSVQSLKAISVNQDNLFTRLSALSVQQALFFNYKVKRPLIILDGKKAPQEYSGRQIKRDIEFLKKKLSSNWLKKIFYQYYYSKEFAVLEYLEENIEHFRHHDQSFNIESIQQATSVRKVGQLNQRLEGKSLKRYKDNFLSFLSKTFSNDFLSSDSKSICITEGNEKAQIFFQEKQENKGVPDVLLSGNCKPCYLENIMQFGIENNLSFRKISLCLGSEFRKEKLDQSDIEKIKNYCLSVEKIQEKNYYYIELENPLTENELKKLQQQFSTVKDFNTEIFQLLVGKVQNFDFKTKSLGFSQTQLSKQRRHTL